MADRISFLVVLVIVASVPILFGSVQVWVWTWYSCTIFTAFSITLMFNKSLHLRFLNSVPAYLLILFFLGLLAQTLPAPSSLASLFGSEKHELYTASASLIGKANYSSGLSYNTTVSVSRSLFLLSLAALYTLICSAIGRRRMTVLLWLLFAVSSMEALYGIVQALVPNMGVLWVNHIQAYLGDARGTYINRNHFAGYMEMMIPLMLGFALSREDWNSEISWRRYFSSDRPHLQFLLSLGLVMMVLALLFSRSRAGITGFVIGLVLFFFLVRIGRKSMPLSVKVSLLAISGLVLFYGLQIGFGPIFDRFLHISSDASRLDFWRDSLPIIAAHPLGTGLGTFEQVFAVHNVSTVADIRITDLHNDYLQLLMEAGWIGFAALFGLFFWYLAASMRKVARMKISDDPLKFFLAAGALSGLVSMAFHSFFDFNLQVPANCIYLVTLIAIVQICTQKTLMPKVTVYQERQNAGFVYVR